MVRDCELLLLRLLVLQGAVHSPHRLVNQNNRKPTRPFPTPRVSHPSRLVSPLIFSDTRRMTISWAHSEDESASHTGEDEAGNVYALQTSDNRHERHRC